MEDEEYGFELYEDMEETFVESEATGFLLAIKMILQEPGISFEPGTIAKVIIYGAAENGFSWSNMYANQNLYKVVKLLPEMELNYISSMRMNSQNDSNIRNTARHILRIFTNEQDRIGK